MKPPKPPAPRPGAMAPPPMVVQDNTVYFFGDVIEKVAPKKYKITKGGFSTCVQPTPRWDLHADTVILNLDHYTMLKNAILEVKGVPLFYLPVLYYPTKKDQRATGLLIPAFGTSTLTGTSLHNAFFWAINRSQDATFYHDWFSKTGQGAGSEYRYNYGPGENGNIRAYYLDQKAVDYSADGGYAAGRRARVTRFAAAPTSNCRATCGPAPTSTTSPASRPHRPSTPTSTTRRATTAPSAPTSSVGGARTR